METIYYWFTGAKFGLFKCIFCKINPKISHDELFKYAAFCNPG